MREKPDFHEASDGKYRLSNVEFLGRQLHDLINGDQAAEQFLGRINGY